MDLIQPVRCIVKLGGAAITCKNELETIHKENLATVSSHLRKTMVCGASSENTIGMDWSKQPGQSDIARTADDFKEHEVHLASPFIVVHGAGSFGHFQASKSGVHKGGLDRALVKAGFVATRISVTLLNLKIVRALAREGIPSVGMSPFSCGWSTRERNMNAVDLHGVSKAINSGFVPVLHGDAVFDDSMGCTILSGDVIIRHLAEHLKPDYVVFLIIHLYGDFSMLVFAAAFQTMLGDSVFYRRSTNDIILLVVYVDDIVNTGGDTFDVLGVYDRPPTEPNAVLLREIAVDEDGRWSVIQPILPHTSSEVEVTVAAHDTTGGMAAKISEAAMIAKLGIEVYIVKAATVHSLTALSGEIRGKLPDDWLGTVIRFSG